MSLSSEIAGTIEQAEQEELRLASIAAAASMGQNPITLNQRMMSACAGSLLTSLVVTPFDVVRIRLQQQHILMPHALTVSEQCCKGVTYEQEPGSVKQNTLMNKGSSSIPRSKNLHTGIILNEFCETNACAQDVKIRGTFSGISKIYTNEGFFSLYRGLSLVLLMAIPSNVVYFSGYEYLRDSSPIQNYSVINPLLCGAIARIFSATSVAPIELLKTRLQSIPTTSKLKSNDLMRLVLKSSLKEIRESGLRSLFRGLQITLWRDVPFSGIYWSSYEFCSHNLRKHVSYLNPTVHPTSSAKIDSKVFLSSFLSGSISGIIAAIATNPFDVGKTRLQVSLDKEKKSMFRFLYSIVKNEGPAALYVGLLPRCLKIAPSCAIMISTYELSKRFFSAK